MAIRKNMPSLPPRLSYLPQITMSISTLAAPIPRRPAAIYTGKFNLGSIFVFDYKRQILQVFFLGQFPFFFLLQLGH